MTKKLTKSFIEKAVNQSIKQYGKTYKMLGEEKKTDIREWEEEFGRKFCVMDIEFPIEEWELKQPYTSNKKDRIKAKEFLLFISSLLHSIEKEVEKVTKDKKVIDLIRKYETNTDK